jgi:hypothetical protein
MMNHDKIVIIFFFILFLLVQPCAGETEWIDHGQKTLYWGQTVNINDYTIDAVDFSPSRFTDFEDDWVLLEIYENEYYSDGATLAINNSHTNNTAILCKDKLKIVVKEIITGFDIASPYVVFQVYVLKEEPVSTISPEQWINETLEFSKCVSGEMYAGDWINVEIRVKGLKDIDLDIRINDSIPTGFELVPDPGKKLMWNMALPDKKSTDLRQYTMKATKPGTFTIPCARVVLEYRGATYTKFTDTSQIIIHGPDINATKTAEILENKSIAVTVSVKNIGDRVTMVYVADEIPENAELVSGDLDFEVVAQPGKTYSNDYILRANNNNNIDLPPVTVTFKDNREREYEVKSEIVHVAVQTPTPTPTPSPTAMSNSTQTSEITEPDNSSITEKLGSIIAILYNTICKLLNIK